MGCALSSAPHGVEPAPTPDHLPATLTDLRFRALVGEAAWAELPCEVQQRFSKFIGPDTTVVYRGHVLATELSALGAVLSFLARIIGGPLPLTNGATGDAQVEVRGERWGGQTWTRTYTREPRPPQVVRSCKRFRGPTGLEEYVGGGIGMALTLAVDKGALYFRSDHYFFELGRLRVRLPKLLEPGVMDIVHTALDADTFSFRLTLTHWLFGCLLHQLAVFCDPKD